MNQVFRFARLASLLTLVLACGPQQGRGEDLRARDLVRIKKTLSDRSKVIALSYEVLLSTEDGTEKAVDPAVHRFRLGDTFRVRIHPATDAYVYMFYEGASGKTDCLLPHAGEPAPRCKAGQVIELPDDGTVFQFSLPPGRENLIVVATEEPVADLTALGGTVFKTKEGSKTLESIKHESLDLTPRGVLSAEALEAAHDSLNSESPKAGVMVDRPTKTEPATFVVGYTPIEKKRADLVVEIPLVSSAN